MNSSDKSPSSRRTPENASMESLLLALDAETDALSPDIVDRLAAARRRAVMRSVSQQIPDKADAIAVARSNQGTLIHQNDPENTIDRLQRHVNTLWQNRPVSASLATCCVASLAAILVINSAQMLSSPTESMIKMTPQSELAANPISADTNISLVKAASLETDSVDLLPIMSSEESLDLVGSVDFLLWLDSQQG
ncbi:DUF3619 family protein [Granulosicoccus antarcticus]|uniref:Uncharacterized protein n=1 Tax=Granulosicoccus antarcticus IMCC3135 TaxID=1192854 RepID=A0A2Z2NVP8_9GAMM|nr:DUF3619 family protein [Granulosicoccus antarcticus]ASJ71234.1 hypothetical protein IMCC3135_05610 [Granulosicoccus antarcticus IMCC3135]